MCSYSIVKARAILRLLLRTGVYVKAQKIPLSGINPYAKQAKCIHICNWYCNRKLERCNGSSDGESGEFLQLFDFVIMAIDLGFDQRNFLAIIRNYFEDFINILFEGLQFFLEHFIHNFFDDGLSQKNSCFCV